MNPWNTALREGLVAGSMASLLSTAALIAFGRRETGSMAAPLNAVSHWVHEPEALYVDEPSLRYTGVGYATHHAASILWATLYAAGRQLLTPGRPPSLAGAAATTAVAALVDFKMTPARFTPGFEHRLSHTALVGVYAALALGTYLGARAYRRLDAGHGRTPF
ncbi:hypothetical protein JI739_06570 [Ramlibacter sp. AW1]|uniref:Uncharacterized protein n=1 Tax=Ramlibacter aurantiacus TaxID=2801330 RepID=A0A937D459_9BURK|nr:hypothetical protein [Ramlibacter aurantiacus]MBL0420007.1 hypothetical protein [Ramlibacter aurantiacus]